MRDRADVVVIGAGIMGLATAYNLAKRHGITNVTVVERSYLCSGASGRNGGGIRAQWSSETNVRLMRESIRICEEFAAELKINVWLRQGGYLFVVRDEARRKAMEASVRVQNAAGLGTRMLTPKEAKRIVPELAIEGVVAASYNPTDGVVFPWPFIWGYAEGAKALGVEIATFTNVLGFDTEGDRITAVRTDQGTVRTGAVVNAAGAWSPQIARLLDVELPNKPHRHEICSTEPLKPFLSPLVAELGNGLYFSQSTRGEIVGGISNEDVPAGIDMGSSHDFLRRYARALVRACPILGDVKILRQWAGCYDLTPDANPIVGPVDGMQRFYQASGFMGHGFMMAPVLGRLLADFVAREEMTPLFERWNLRRFRTGQLLTESMILG
jgi:sarcosine oxidase, subunit beta